MNSVLKQEPFMGIVIILLALFAVCGQLDFNDERTEDALYCEMVKLYREGGEGWPDYKGIFKDACPRLESPTQPKPNEIF